MQTSLIVIQQVIVILILLAVGAVGYKTHMISEKAADSMAALCLKIVTPCVIINTFQIDYDPKKLVNMLIAALLAILTHVVGIVISNLVFKKDNGSYRIRRFATVYSNCGFMGIPLISGVIGNEGVLYACIYIVVFQAMMWSHGVITIKGGMQGIKLHKIFINAGTIGIAMGLPLFFLSIRLPAVLSQSVGHIANLNTPLAMIVSGVYVAKSDLKKAFTRPINFLAVFLRQVAVPLITLFIILPFDVEKTVFLSILIISACPTASAVTLFASLYGNERDLECAGRVLTLSTVLSIVTIPAVSVCYSLLSAVI